MNNDHATLLRQVADALDAANQRGAKRDLWTRDRVAEYLATSTDKLDKYRAMGNFPKPVLLGGEKRMVRWVPDEIECWALSQRGSF